jgi:hypothetical protein
MEGSLFGLAMLAMLIIAYWSMTNDKAGPKGHTRGLLAMHDPEDTADPAAKEAAGPVGPPRASREEVVKKFFLR